MKLFLILRIAILFLAVHCAHSPKGSQDPWMARNPQPPKRILFLAIDGLTQESLQSGAFTFLKERGAQTPKTESGLLFSTPATDLAVAHTGLAPRDLFYADQLFRDAKGSLGPRNNLYNVASLNRGQWNRLASSPHGLLPLLKQQRAGKSYAIAPSPTLAFALGIAGADDIRYPKKEVPYWAQDQLFSIMNSDPQWQAILAVLPQENVTLTLEKLFQHLESKNLVSETLWVLFGFHSQTPPVLWGNQTIDLLKHFPPNAITAVVNDSVIRIWVQSPNRLKVAEMATKAERIADVADIYSKEQTGKSVHYIRTYRNPELPEDKRAWAETKHQFLVEAMVSPSSADLIVVRTPAAQAREFPLLIWSPNLKRDVSPPDSPPARLVDLTPIAARLLGIPQALEEEGHSTTIDPYVQD